MTETINYLWEKGFVLELFSEIFPDVSLIWLLPNSAALLTNVGTESLFCQFSSFKHQTSPQNYINDARTRRGMAQ